MIAVGQLEDCGDLLGSLWPNGPVGPMPMLRSIRTVTDQINQSIREVLLSDDVNQGLFGFFFHAKLHLNFWFLPASLTAAKLGSISIPAAARPQPKHHLLPKPMPPHTGPGRNLGDASKGLLVRSTR